MFISFVHLVPNTYVLTCLDGIDWQMPTVIERQDDYKSWWLLQCSLSVHWTSKVPQIIFRYYCSGNTIMTITCWFFYLFFTGRVLWRFSLTFTVLLLCSCTRMARSRESWDSWYVSLNVLIDFIDLYVASTL